MARRQVPNEACDAVTALGEAVAVLNDSVDLAHEDNSSRNYSATGGRML